MGDGSDVVSRRMEDQSQEGLAFKELEKEVKGKEQGLERPAGEPGEARRRSPDAMPMENNLAEVAVTEPLLPEPETIPFLYADTKLRPDAPPFTPECISPTPEPAYGDPEIDNACFVNVDLRSTTPEDQLLPEPELPAVPIPLTDLKDLKDLGLKPFSLTSNPHVKKSVPKIEIPSSEEEDPVVSVRPAVSPEVVAGQPAERASIFSPAFFLGNKTQIAVLIASLVICAILIIYVLV